MKVTYCEWLALGEPIEREMEEEEARKRYNIKLKALEGYFFKDTCFLGIKDLDGKWLMKNE